MTKPALLLAAAWAVLGAQPALAQSGQKISQLPAASALAGSELLAGVQGGGDVSITPAQIGTYLASSFPQFPSSYTPGNWYHPPFLMAVQGLVATANRMEFYPIVLFRAVTVQQIGVRIALAASGGNVQVAVYSDGGGYPATPIAVTPSMSTASVGVVAAAPTGGNFTLQPGVYWIGTVFDNATASCQTPSAAFPMASWLFGSPAQSQTNIAISNTVDTFEMFQNIQFGTPWPTFTSSGWTEQPYLPTFSCLVQFEAA